jgi:uncharacterized membrane protein
MALVLRAGLLLSAAFLLAGLLMFLWEHPSESLATLLSSNPIQGYLDPLRIVAGLEGWHPEAFLSLGVIILVATPFLRVATGFWYFLESKDREMATLTGIVLGLLLLGILVIGPLLR